MNNSARTHNSVSHRNLELKVVCDEATLELVRDRLTAAGVTTVRVRQTDTYFSVPHGRLKLRQIDGPTPDDQTAELIAYARADAAGARWSTYDRIPLSPVAALPLRDALVATIGVRVVVAKEREVGIPRRTRVHLDRVDGLGRFVELETIVASGEDEAGAAAELTEIAALLGLDRLPSVAGSYADLAEGAEGRGQRAGGRGRRRTIRAFSKSGASGSWAGGHGGPPLQ